MATWMTHLRVAEELLRALPGLSAQPFIIGNLAPDCGQPNEDWTQFTPPKSVTHFLPSGDMSDIEAERFRAEYLEPCEEAAYPFYLGYYCHLRTDIYWSRQIGAQTQRKFSQQLQSDHRFWAKIKTDWYDLDHLYLKNHPDFYAFDVVKNTACFDNTYLDFYPESAISGQLDYIKKFYSHTDHVLERDYPFLTMGEMDDFVVGAVSFIKPRL